MGKNLEYFKYDGKTLGLTKLINIEEYLTDMIDYIDEAYEVTHKEIDVLHNLIWPKVNGDDYPRPMDDKMNELHSDAMRLLIRNSRRYMYDIESLKKSRGILCRYKKTIYS